MPYSELKAVTINHVYDDDSCVPYVIANNESESSGQYVSIGRGDDSIWLHPESWPAIRDAIQQFFDEAEWSQTNFNV